MRVKTKPTKRKDLDEPTPPENVPPTSFTLKRVERNEEPKSTNVNASSQTFDSKKIKKSFKRRPWILHDQIIHLEKLDYEHHKKVTAHWRPEESCRLELDSAPVFHPTKEEFENPLQYISKIRMEAEEYGICSIVPPDSWKPHCPMEEKEIWENSRFHTRVQRINELQNVYLKRELKKVTEKMKGNRDSLVELDYGSHGSVFEKGPEFTLQTFKKYAEDFEEHYFKKQNISTWENVEGEYWRVVQNPTEEIQVLSGHNLDVKVLGSGFPLLSDSPGADQTEYVKSGWNLNSTPKLPSSLFAFESCGDSSISAPLVDVGMCFSSDSWKVEEHSLYLLSYLPLGVSRIWYGIPGRHYSKCLAALKKTFPELSRHPNLFHKLVAQLPPSILKSEGIPVFRCLQHPKQFVLIFPGACYSGFNSGFNVSVRVNLAPLDWLPYGQQSVENYSEMHRKTSISYDKLLIEGCKDTARSLWLLIVKRNSKEGKIACGTDGWLTRALKSRVQREHLRRKYLCNTSKSSRMMDKDFNSNVKKECIICYYDLYLSAVACSCSPERYACLEHSKQVCSCPWSSRIFLFRHTIDELNLLIDALEGKHNALHKWANENRDLFSNVATTSNGVI